MAGAARATAYRSAFGRLIAAALALTCVLAPIVASVHALGAAHVICAEHGEIMDAPGDASPARVVLADAERLRGAPGDQPARAHEHCRFIVLLHQHARASSPPLALTTPAVQSSSGRSAPASLPPRRILAVYRLAPKTSPPV